MNTSTPKEFAAICYVILMAHRRPYHERSPSYIAEKLVMLNTGYDAYGFLDRGNQQAVQNYCDIWHLKLPEPIEKYEKELNRDFYDASS